MTPLIDRRPEKLSRLTLIGIKMSTPEQMLVAYNSLVDAYNTLIDAYISKSDIVDNLETEVFSLRNQNKLWECIVEGYKKEKEEEE